MDIQLPWQPVPQLSGPNVALPPDLMAMAQNGAQPGAPQIPQIGAPPAAAAAPQAQPAQPQYPGLKRPPPAIGSTVNGMTYLGGDPRSKDHSVWAPASGDTFLNSLPIDDTQKTLIKGIANYDLPPGSQRGGLGSPEVQQLLGLAKQYDPTFSASDYSVRQKTKQDFSTGQYSKTVTALNTAIDHAHQLAENGKALNNHGGFGTMLNSPENWIEEHLGDPRQGNFRQLARQVGGEVTKAVTGGEGSMQDRQAAAADYPLNGAPEQQKQAIGQTVMVLKSKLDELNEAYKRGNGGKGSVISLLSPSAQKSWLALSNEFGTPTARERIINYADLP